MSFFVLGPVIAVAAVMLYENWKGDLPGAWVPISALYLYMFVWPASGVVGAIDQYLARSMPTRIRALLMTFLGAAVAVGLLHVIARVISMKWGLVPLSTCAPIAFIGAIIVGACSLLATERGGLPE